MSFFLGTRRIQKTKYTFLLPLPAIWAKNVGLCQGSSCDIVMLDENTIRITPSSTERPRTETAGCANTL